MVGIDPTRLPTPEDVDAEATADTEDDSSARSNIFDDHSPRLHHQQHRSQHHYVTQQHTQESRPQEESAHDDEHLQGMDDPHGRAAMALTSLSMGDERFVERGTRDQVLGELRVRRRGDEGVDFDPDASTARAPWPRATIAEAQLLFEVTQTTGTTATTATTTGYSDVAAVTPQPLDDSAGGDVGATGARRIVSPSTKTQEEGGGARFKAVAGSTHETIHAPHSLVRSFSSSSISSDIPARGLVRAAPLLQEDAMATDECHPRGKVQNVSGLFYSNFMDTSSAGRKLIGLHRTYIMAVVVPFAQSATVPSEPQV